MLSRVPGLALIVLLAAAGCILRPGMNAECRWPAEVARTLDLSHRDDERHLVLDAELVDELVDRHRFHPADAQRRCLESLIREVAQVHSVTPADVARARERVPDRGLDLPVIVPMSVLFLLSVGYVLRRIERRFGEEPLPRFLSLAIACVGLSGAFVFVGELWTSVLQMIRVGSQHVGGRVHKLPWLQHQTAIFVVGIGLFWVVVWFREVRRRRRGAPV